MGCDPGFGFTLAGRGRPLVGKFSAAFTACLVDRDYFPSNRRCHHVESEAAVEVASFFLCLD
jgi:hypothetical protein